MCKKFIAIAILLSSLMASAATAAPHGFGPGRAGGFRGGVVVGFPGAFWYGPYWGYPYPYYDPYYFYYYPEAAYPAAPYPPMAFWYYCPDPRGYYPYVAACKKPWQEVSTTTATPVPPAESDSEQ